MNDQHTSHVSEIYRKRSEEYQIYNLDQLQKMLEETVIKITKFEQDQAYLDEKGAEMHLKGMQSTAHFRSAQNAREIFVDLKEDQVFLEYLINERKRK